MEASFLLATAPSRRLNLSAERELIMLFTAASGALLVFYPIAALALSSLLLINLPSYTPRYARLTLVLVASLAFSMMTGARPLAADDSNDIYSYYAVYQGLGEGDFSQLTIFGGGLEVALPLLMYVWSLVLPPLSENGLMFCLALTSCLLMVLWVETTFYASDTPQRPALLGICILMFNLYMSTQLVRQVMASIILLFAFSAKGRVRQGLLVVLAASFHLTALLFYAIYLLACRGWRGWIAIIALAFLFRIYFSQLLVAFDVLPEAAADKLLYYVDNNDDSSSADLGSLRMVFLLGVVSISVWIANHFRAPKNAWPWMAVPWITAVVHFLLLPVPLASLRTTLTIHSIAPGFLAHRMLSYGPRTLMAIGLNLLFLYKIISFAAAPASGNLLSSLAILQGLLI